jgi:hypothetical protein
LAARRFDGTEQPFLGTTHPDGLPYRNVDITRYYPYGNPAFRA